MPSVQWIDLLRDQQPQDFEKLNTTLFKRAINKHVKPSKPLDKDVYMHHEHKSITINGKPRCRTDFWCMSTHPTNVYAIKGGTSAVQTHLQMRYDQYVRWKKNPTETEVERRQTRSDGPPPSSPPRISVTE